MSRVGLLLTVAAGSASAQVPVKAINPPRLPLPAESASAGVTRFSFIAYGDTRGPRDSTELQQAHGWVVESVLQRTLAAANGPDPIKFVLQSGDAVQNGRSAKMLNVGFTPLIDRITTEAGIPFYLAPGNHDVTTALTLGNVGRDAGLANYLAANVNMLPPEGSAHRLNGYPTYAFGYGNTFVLALDSDISPDTTQFIWVSSQLKNLDRRRYVNVIVFCHHPAYSSGPHGGLALEAATRGMRDLYLPLFRKYHVTLLLTGHEHLFEHWVEHYSDASGTHRLDELVSGGGGAPLYPYMSEPDLTEYLAAGADAHVRLEHLVKPTADTLQDPHHYLVIHVDGPKLTVEVVGVGWGQAFAPYPAGRILLADPEDRR